MSASVFAATVAIWRFCSLVSFLISPLLRTGRGPSRNQSNYFLAVRGGKTCVDNKQNHARRNLAESDEPLLIFVRFVAQGQSPRVVEDDGSSVEIDAVFG